MLCDTISRHRMTGLRDIWEKLIEGAAVVKVAPSDPIFRISQTPQPVAILSGVVRMFMFTPGGRPVTFRDAGPGELIGLMARLGESDALESQAVTWVSLAILPLEHIEILVRRQPEIFWAIAQDSARRAIDAVRRVADATAAPMTVRVARHLLDLATTDSDGNIVAPVSHQMLADAVGTAREVVTRTIKGFRSQGLVATRIGSIIITDTERLSQVAAVLELQHDPGIRDRR